MFDETATQPLLSSEPTDRRLHPVAQIIELVKGHCPPESFSARMLEGLDDKDSTEIARIWLASPGHDGTLSCIQRLIVCLTELCPAEVEHVRDEALSHFNAFTGGRPFTVGITAQYGGNSQDPDACPITIGSLPQADTKHRASYTELLKQLLDAHQSWKYGYQRVHPNPDNTSIAGIWYDDVVAGRKPAGSLQADILMMLFELGEDPTHCSNIPKGWQSLLLGIELTSSGVALDHDEKHGEALPAAATTTPGQDQGTYGHTLLLTASKLWTRMSPAHRAQKPTADITFDDQKGDDGAVETRTEEDSCESLSPCESGSDTEWEEERRDHDYPSINIKEVETSYYGTGEPRLGRPPSTNPT